MIVDAYKLRSLAMALCFTAPFVGAQEVSSGLNANAAAELLYQLETLQSEVKALRGITEEQANEIAKMRRSQLDRYIDLDKRIALLMSQQANMSVPSVAKPSETTVNTTAAEPSRSPVVAPALVAPVITAAPIAVAPVALSEPTQEVQSAYNQAYELIRKRDFLQADQAFAKFVIDFPQNTLTGNAYYWLGELKLVLGDQTAALVNFDIVTKRFAGHSKEVDALYKMGTTENQLGNVDRARVYLTQVIQKFPNTDTAKLATSYLENLK